MRRRALFLTIFFGLFTLSPIAAISPWFRPSWTTPFTVMAWVGVFYAMVKDSQKGPKGPSGSKPGGEGLCLTVKLPESAFFRP